jgi:predicted exporter
MIGKVILIIIVLAVIWTIWWFFGHILFGLEGVLHSWGLMIISGTIIGFILAPYDNPKKEIKKYRLH